MSQPVRDEYAEKLLGAMVEIPSPSGGEAELARFLVGRMEDLGFTARIDRAGNVVGELDRGPGPTVMLLGHMDTVPGTLPVRFEGDRLYGRGTVDAKGPLAAMICAAARAREFRGRAVVVGVVEEETPLSRGAMHLRAAHPLPDALVVGEPSGWSNVVLGYRGKIDLEYRVRCRATHPSNPAPKAADRCVLAWTELLALLGPHATHEIFDAPGATLISVDGDTTLARARFDIRIPPGFDAAGLVAELRGRLPEGDLELIATVAACRTGRTDPVVRALYRTIADQGGRPVAKVKTATSDMNTLAEAWKIPMATYGPGDSRLDHSDEEHISLTEFHRGVSVLTGALAAMPGLLGR
ncbi:M20/M25/M40 family metallo-hydrolase [Actinomadura viridis]|uniref:M20/M25/M40 family metallo-hydrolase n=1 Tax=Actinomadura viridis TaxID=58110 RepID=UPI00368160CF